MSNFLEITSNDNWFKLHPEKIAGVEYETTSFYFPIMVKGTKEDVLRVTGINNVVRVPTGTDKEKRMRLAKAKAKAVKIKLSLGQLGSTNDKKLKPIGNIEETTQRLNKKILDIGYFTDISRSKTSFGNSNYIFVDNKKDEFGFIVPSKKIRISDHSVTNIDRIFNEIHVEPGSKSFESTLNELKWYYDSKKYFTKEVGYKEVKAYGVQTKTLMDSDFVTKEFTTKKGDKMYEVTRTYLNKVDFYKFKGTDKTYKTVNHTI